ncbi:MAG: type II secretion system F family protein, partial [Planctomycetota bacterium]|nr:type II secretion system F family protein [Planctomycetota bacterium]
MAKKIQRKMSGGAAATKGAARTPSSSGGGPPKKKGRGKRVSGQTVTDFTLQLATLSSAGIPIVRALSVLHGQTPNGPFKQVLAEVVEDVASGT